MKNNIFKNIAALLSVAILLAQSTPALAENQEFNSNNTANIKIGTTVESAWKVSLPTSIILTKKGDNYSATITKSVSGDIAANKELVVVPQDQDDSTNGIQINLTDEGTLTHVAILTDSNTIFTHNQLSATPTDYNATIVTSGFLKAGVWSGKIKYNINFQAAGVETAKASATVLPVASDKFVDVSATLGANETKAYKVPGFTIGDDHLSTDGNASFFVKDGNEGMKVEVTDDGYVIFINSGSAPSGYFVLSVSDSSYEWAEYTFYFNE